jgi:ATP-dependent Zn protease
MDRDVRELIEALYARVRAALSVHRAALEALAVALRERETLEGSEALEIFRAHGVPISPAAD